MKVKDIMTKNVISVKPNSGIDEVVYVLRRIGHHGVPVVNDKKLVGIITKSDLFSRNSLNVYLPSYIDNLKKIKFVDKMKLAQGKKLEKLLDTKAKDLMTVNFGSINENEEAIRLIDIFKKSNYYTIPVVNDNNQLVGIVTIFDFISKFDI